jgi:hypothetical protein
LGLWKERSKLWQMIENGPITELMYLPPPPSAKRKYPSLKSLVSSQKEAKAEDIEIVKAECDCQRCQVEILIKKQRLSWKPQKVKMKFCCSYYFLKVSESTIFVGRLPYSTKEEDLVKNFAMYGKIVNVFLVKNCQTQKSRGYGFVEYASVSEAEDAIAESQQFGMKIQEKSVIVDSVKAGFDSNFFPRRLGGGVGKGRS